MKAKITTAQMSLIKVALENRFPGQNIDGLLEVVMSCDNPDIACLMVINKFETRLLPASIVYDGGVVYNIVEIDWLKQYVTAEAERPKERFIWIDKDVNVDLARANPEQFSVIWTRETQQNLRQISIKTEEMEKFQRDFTISTWEVYANKVQKLTAVAL